MKKLIELAVNRPKSVLIILAVITLFSVCGVMQLKMDSSTEVLLPKSSAAYNRLQRTKEIFGDTKTFHITAIEPANGHKLISSGVFHHIHPLIQEINEFKSFNKNREEKRSALLITLCGASAVKNNSQPVTDQSPALPGSDNAMPDLPGGSQNGADNNSDTDSNIWNTPGGKQTVHYAKPYRAKQHYKITAQRTTTVKQLKNNLDPTAARQLQTILIVAGLAGIREDKPLTDNEKLLILNNWEELLLHKSMPIIKTALDPLTASDIKGKNNSLTKINLLPVTNGKTVLPDSPRDLQQYRMRLTANPAYEAVLYATNRQGKIAALAMSMTLRPLKNSDWIFNFLHQTIKKYNNGPVKLTQMGSFMYQKYLLEYMRSDIKKLVPLVILVVILTFYFNFRSKRGVVLPTLSVVFSTLWTFGLMGWLQIPITLVVNLLPPLLIAVSSSYSIHILNQYYLDHDQIFQAGNRTKRLKRSMQSISVTVLLAALTTFIGFLTLVTNWVVSLQHFGLFAAIGTIFAMLAASLLLPAALSLLKPLPVKKRWLNRKERKHTNATITKLVSRFNKISIEHAKGLSVLSLLIIIIFSLGISRIYVESSAAYMLKKDSFLYKADIHLGNLFKGHMVTNLVFDSGKPGGAYEPDFLKFIEKFRKWAVNPYNRTNYHILHTATFSDIIKRMHMAMHNGNRAYYRIPDKKSTIQDYLQLYSGKDSDLDGRADSLEQFIDPAARYVNVLLRKGSQGNKPITTRQNEAGQNAIDRWLQKHGENSGYSWKATGEPLTFVVLGKMVIRGQVVSIILTLLFVSIIIIMLFRNPISGLLAVIPIGISVVFIYGLMGYLNIPLDMPKAVLAAIAIGIGVDDTIHMLKTMRHHLQKGESITAALSASHHQAGLAIVYTSIALILGFSVLLFSEFVPVFYLGLLVALTMISTTASALLLLPAAAYLLRKHKLNEEKENRFFKKIKIADYFDMS